MKTRFVLISLITAACASPAKEDAKGQVDESAPPSSPSQLGKSDDSSRTVAVDVQSAHPYTNNLSRTYNVPLSGLPSCAQTARLHFKVLRTEANYDFVTSVETGEEFDGIADDTWTGWFAVDGLAAARVTLDTDGSITRHGFEIDKIEWDGVPEVCPAVIYPACADEYVDVAPRPGTCECPVAPQCVPLDEVVVSHHLYRGFNNTTKTARGSVAEFTHPGPADAPETDTWGTVDIAQVRAVVRRAAELGLLQGAGYARPVDWNNGFGEDFTINAGPYQVTFTATQGQQDAAVQALIDDFESLFTCGSSGGGLTCGSGYECDQGGCVEAAPSCICPALYDPQCGINGHTYGNACEAGCADMPVAHAGECGITGDMCGSMMGLTCVDGYKCRFGDSQYTYPYPDASGTCVAENYCDAPVDCTDLPHIAVPGAWGCVANACEWQTGSAWTTLDNFSTTNPYANNMSVWHQAYLPAGAQAMRLSALRFATETNYDKLEVWTWKNGAWTRVRSYTGTAGPALTDEFPGQYHYLKFVSDSSIVKAGVSVDVQYR